ncbi:unnamed protein product [Prunus armeniaca]
MFLSQTLATSSLSLLHKAPAAREKEAVNKKRESFQSNILVGKFAPTPMFSRSSRPRFLP